MRIFSGWLSQIETLNGHTDRKKIALLPCKRTGRLTNTQIDLLTSQTNIQALI